MKRVLLIFGLAFVVVLVQAQEKPPSASLQEQLDDLKQGQERIIEELEALRSAIQAKPARAEFPARPVTLPILNVHGEPFRGRTNATLGIITYSDFDCSHCAKFAAETLPKLNAAYIETGKVKYFFRDLPEPGNAESLLKATIARCAGEQGKFWQAHHYLFTKQPVLAGNSLAELASALGLDRPKLEDCLKEPKYSQMIQRSVASAARLRIQGTPAFLVGELSGDVFRVKQILLGAEEFEKFQTVIEELLAGTNEKPAPQGAEQAR